MVCKRVKLALSLLLHSWIFTSLVVFVSGLNCPDKQYPYTCPSCLSITTDERLEFDSAKASCHDNDGNLVTIEDPSQFQRLVRYLEGFNLSSNRLWVGYHYDRSANRVGTDGKAASPVLMNQSNFGTGDTFRSGDCIEIQGERFFSSSCSEPLGYICVHHYEVPKLTSSAGGVEYAAPGQSISLEIELQGRGISSVEWRHRGMETLPDGVETDTNSEFTSSEIRIESFDLESHSGVYEFLVTNPAGISVLVFWELQRAVLGEITVQPQDVDLPGGQIAAFECRAEKARPEPTIVWYRGSTLLVSDGAKINVSELTGTLFIRDIRSSDAGSYHCVASNVAGAVESRQASLSVVAENVTAPSFYIHPRSVTVLAGRPYSLECVGVLTKPSPSLTKFYMVDLLVPSALFYYPSDPGAPFHVKTAMAADNNSSMSCQFGGAPGPHVTTIYAEIAILTVHTVPFVEELTTNITSHGTESSPGFQSIPAGSGLTLSCTVNSSTVFQNVTWTVNGTTIEGSRNDGTSVLELGPSHVRPGVHQCAVSDTYGDDISSLVLCNSDGLPSSVTSYAFADTLTSLYVNWMAPLEPNTHPALLQYRVYYAPMRTGNRVGVIDPTSFLSVLLPAYETATVLGGLEEDTRYEVFVVAYSFAGEGRLPTDVATAVTFSSAPSTSIPSEAIVVMRTADDTALIVTWEYDPPINTVHYEIEYRAMSRANGGTVKVSNQLEVTEVIQGLVDASNYEVRLRLAVQVRRDPVKLVSGPWSEWIMAKGITTLPPDREGIATEEAPTTQGLLLVIILVPVAVFVISVILVCMFLVIGLWRYKHRPKQSYRPAEEESRVDELRPMGNLVFDLPLSPVNSAFNSTYATSLDEPYSKSQDGGFDHQQMLTAGTLSMDVCLSGSQSGSRDDLGAVGVSAAGNMDDELDQGKGAFRSWNGSMNQINAVVESHTCSMDGGLHRTRRHESVDGGVDEIRSVSRDSGLADEMPVDGRSKYNSSIVLPNCDTYT